MLGKLLGLLFPPKCMMCGRLLEKEEIFLMCPDCAGEAALNSGKRCRICAAPIEVLYGGEICHRCRKEKRWFEKAYTPFIYEGGVRNAIKSYKFYDKKAYAKPLASFMFADIKNHGGFDNVDLITFVPLHFNRQSERGYNQSQLLAENLGEFSGKSVADTLKKTVNTKPLSVTRHSRRSEIVKGAFAVRADADIKGKRILLIDDIITTGATVNECARMLVKSGAESVFVAAIASTRR